jgi:hypothetical protein
VVLVVNSHTPRPDVLDQSGEVFVLGPGPKFPISGPSQLSNPSPAGTRAPFSAQRRFVEFQDPMADDWVWQSITFLSFFSGPR